MGVLGAAVHAAGAACSARAAARVLPVPWKWVAGPFLSEFVGGTARRYATAKRHRDRAAATADLLAGSALLSAGAATAWAARSLLGGRG